MILSKKRFSFFYFQEESVSMESFNPIRAAEEEEEAGALIIKVCNLTLHSVVLIGILMLISEVSTN